MERYSRQLVLPEWSERGAARAAQRERARAAPGALGSPVALYLAGAGVGRLGIVDEDEVELSNLHRQPLHFTPDIGAPKAESAAAKLRFLNPEIVVEPYQVRVDAANAAGAGRGPRPGGRLLGLVRDPLRRQRRLLRGRRAARRGGVLGFERAGDEHQAGRTACYRCAFPQRPRDAPTCADAGVLGPAAGVVGSLQALEAIKLLTGVAPAVADGFLQVDLAMRRVPACRTARRDDCPDCGARV